MAAARKELQQQLETQVGALSRIQKDIAKNHGVRRQYTIQHGENEMVQKELELLDDEANVFKLIGPVLVKQDLVEAKANVSKRIEYITAELKRLDITLKTLEESQTSKREETVRNDFESHADDLFPTTPEDIQVTKLQQRIHTGQRGNG